jgi:hypothetical protein
MEPEKLYGQEATHFTLRFVLPPDATVDGRLVLELADTFVDRLVFPGCTLASLWTKPPGMTAKPNIGDFSDKKWEAARKKIAANDCAVLRLDARTADFPNQTIALYVQANPPGGSEQLQTGTIDITCSVPYLRHLAAAKEKTEALLKFGIHAWNGAKAAYGFGNLAITPTRAGMGSFAIGGPPRFGPTAPPAERAHSIPVAQTGNDIDGNIDVLIAKGRGIKGAYWANYLSAMQVQLAGGASSLAGKLTGMTLEPLPQGGLLIVATDTPLPQDSEDNRARFERLEAALRPAFLSREETPENKRALLGYFYRESGGTQNRPE